MSEFKYEIGDEFRCNTFGGHWVRIIARHTTRAGVNVYWLENEVGSPSSYGESVVDEWTKIEPFFEVGDTFTSPFSLSATMSVTHVDEELKSAWVTVTYKDGGPLRKESVGLVAWRKAKEEIFRNRKD